MGCVGGRKGRSEKHVLGRLLWVVFGNRKRNKKRLWVGGVMIV